MNKGRLTLWQALRRDRGGVASLSLLGAIAFACLVGPMIAPHPYDRVFPDYVQTPASLQTHPTGPERDQALRGLALRMHATLDLDARTAQGDEPSVLTITGEKTIDPRVLRTLARSDLLTPIGPAAASADGKRLMQKVVIKQERFLFGTDDNGRDLLTRVLVAGRMSLAVGALASAVALGIGVAYGAVAGYVGGRVDATMMRLVDIIYALPFIFFVIVLVVFFGRTLALIFVAIGAVEWLDMARIVRGQTLSLKRREFVLAAQALGASDRTVLAHHIIPNMSGPIIAYLGVLVPRVILAESFLSFLGLGVQEPLTSWGILIADGARNVQGALHLLIFPAAILALTLVAATRLGEALRRAADLSRP